VKSGKRFTAAGSGPPYYNAASLAVWHSCFMGAQSQSSDGEPQMSIRLKLIFCVLPLVFLGGCKRDSGSQATSTEKPGANTNAPATPAPAPAPDPPCAQTRSSETAVNRASPRNDFSSAGGSGTKAKTIRSGARQNAKPRAFRGANWCMPHTSAPANPAPPSLRSLSPSLRSRLVSGSNPLAFAAAPAHEASLSPLSKVGLELSKIATITTY